MSKGWELKLKKMIRALLVVVGLVVGGYTIMGIVQNNEINQIVKSEEVEQIYLKVLTSIDPDAFTEKGNLCLSLC